mmetsp:Transcript_11108/g.32128  ORF Transcript_11108/g.32128 Transcript_11108/m.32128 type:complete len:249 (+) Transcript_11108:1-747(+)
MLKFKHHRNFVSVIKLVNHFVDHRSPSQKNRIEMMKIVVERTNTDQIIVKTSSVKQRRQGTSIVRIIWKQEFHHGSLAVTWNALVVSDFRHVLSVFSLSCTYLLRSRFHPCYSADQSWRYPKSERMLRHLISSSAPARPSTKSQRRVPRSLHETATFPWSDSGWKLWQPFRGPTSIPLWLPRRLLVSGERRIANRWCLPCQGVSGRRCRACPTPPQMWVPESEPVSRVDSISFCLAGLYRSMDDRNRP